MQDLGGFPLVLALSEDTINNRLAAVSVRTHDLPDEWDLGTNDDDWRLHITRFEAPQIDFNTTIKNGCRLKMKVIDGKFSMELIKVNPETHRKEIVTEDIPLNGISFYITTPVSQIHKEGKRKDGTLGDEIFLVQTLFADLTCVHDVQLEGLSEEIKVKITSTLEASLKELIKAKIKSIAEENPHALLFGSVYIPTISDALQTHGPLAPKGMSYSVSKNMNGSQYQSGALNYLLWVDDPTKMPQGDAVGAFDRILLLKDSNNAYAPGTLVISDYILWDRFIKPEIVRVYTSDKKGHEIPNIVVEHRQGDSPAKLKLQSSFYFEHDGDNQTRFDSIEGVASDKMRIDYTMLARRDHWSGDIYADGKGYVELQIAYENGNLQTSYNAPDPTIDMSCSWATRILGDIITLGFDEISIDTRQTEARDRIKTIGKSITPSITQLLNLIELPGKSVFDFDKAVMAGNLYIRTRYKERLS